MDSPSVTLDRPQPCPDGDCGGMGEPEEEDGLTKYVCGTCGMEWGFQLIDREPEPSCQLGVPEAVRRAGSVPPPAAPVFLGDKIGRRPG